MIGLRSQFGPSLVLVAVTVAVTLVVAVVAARRSPSPAGRLREVWRVLATGAIAVVVLATALPQRWAVATDGDLVLRLGGGGLGGWRVLFEDPTSLASIQLVGNVLLYAAAGLAMTLGWFERRHLVLPLCVALAVLIETVQYGALGRVGSLDDVVLNTVGAALGYAAAFGVMRSRAASQPD